MTHAQASLPAARLTERTNFDYSLPPAYLQPDTGGPKLGRGEFRLIRHVASCLSALIAASLAISYLSVASFSEEPTTAWEPKGKSRVWKAVVFHHSATTTGSVSSIDQSHKQRKDSQGRPWLGIGYHFIIGNGQGMADGQIEATFRWHQQLSGAHAGETRWNAESIGICLIGNFDEQPPTARQLAAAKKLLAWITTQYHLTPQQIWVHGEIKATECPGKKFPYQELLGRPRHAVANS